MFVGTIHSYCLRLLQEHVPQFGNHDILDPHRLAGLLSREHKRLELDKLGQKHWRPILDFMRNVDVVENEVIEPDELDGPFGEVCRGRHLQPDGSMPTPPATWGQHQAWPSSRASEQRSLVLS